MKPAHKRIIADFFTFSKSQRRGTLIAIGLIATCLIIRLSYGFFIEPKIVPVDSVFIQQVAALKMADSNQTYNSNSYARNEPNEPNAGSEGPTKTRYAVKGELFAFDPNKLNADGWKRLGLRDKTIQTILNYVSKGGKFRKPEDIKKIYGLFPDQAERLLPYVRIANSTPEAATYTKRIYEDNKPTDSRPAYVKKSYSTTIFDINTADTTALISLPGIGSKLASRIVTFRQKLGGFSSIAQVGETYGLPDSTFQKIKSRFTLNLSGLKQFNVNTATADLLKNHPYIRWNLANAIVRYREQHGNYASLNDLKKIELIDEQTFVKIAPYLTIE